VVPVDVGRAVDEPILDFRLAKHESTIISIVTQLLFDYFD
jgi:hypothetical protein